MSEDLSESKQLGDYIEEPVLAGEKAFKKTENGLAGTFKPRPPDYICNEQQAVCAWIDKTNPAGEIITFNVHIGELRFRLRKRFL
jgi:hypothetical protein